MESEYRRKVIKEGKLDGLNLALELAELHKKYSQDIDYLISTLKALIEEETR